MAVQQKLNLSIGKVVILSRNLSLIMPKTWIINRQLVYSIVKVAQSCLTLCNPMDCVVHGIFQDRILEFVAFPFTRGSSQPRD